MRGDGEEEGVEKEDNDDDYDEEDEEDGHVHGDATMKIVMGFVSIIVSSCEERKVKGHG